MIVLHIKYRLGHFTIKRLQLYALQTAELLPYLCIIGRSTRITHCHFNALPALRDAPRSTAPPAPFRLPPVGRMQRVRVGLTVAVIEIMFRPHRYAAVLVVDVTVVDHTVVVAFTATARRGLRHHRGRPGSLPRSHMLVVCLTIVRRVLCPCRTFASGTAGGAVQIFQVGVSSKKSV